MKFLIAFLLVISSVSQRVLAEQPNMNDDLVDVIRNMRSDISGITDPQLRQARTQAWIQNIETAIDAHPTDSYVNQAILTLADLYTSVNQPQQALEALDEVLGNALDPGTLLSAMLDAAAVSLPSGNAVEDSLSYTDDFAAMVEHYRVEGVDYPSAFDDDYEQIDLTRAKLLTAAAEWLTNENEGLPAAGLAEMTGPLLVDAASHLELYQQALGDWSDAEVIADAAMRRANALAHAGTLYDNAGYTQFARDLHLGATQTLEAMLEAFPDTRYAQNASTLLLREMSAVAGSTQEYVAYATKLAAVLPPGHEFISFLRADALNMARDSGKLVASTQLFNLVLALEKDWYGDEYGSHVNYQWSLMGGARNALKMGDIEGAGWRIEELRKLDLQGAFFFERMAKLEAAYAEYLEGAYAKDETDDPVFWDKSKQGNKVNQVDDGVLSEQVHVFDATMTALPKRANQEATEAKILIDEVAQSETVEDGGSPMSIFMYALGGVLVAGVGFLAVRRLK